MRMSLPPPSTPSAHSRSCGAAPSCAPHRSGSSGIHRPGDTHSDAACHLLFSYVVFRPFLCCLSHNQCFIVSKMAVLVHDTEDRDAAWTSCLHAASLSYLPVIPAKTDGLNQSAAILCSVATMRSTCGLTVASTRCSFGLWMSFVVTPIDTMSSFGFLRKCQPHSRPA